MNTTKKVWLGTHPEACELCDGDFHDNTFVDGKTDLGVWGIMCHGCHVTHGEGLGLGKGQQYTKQDDGSWVKTGG
jgi:hypothetical protein